MAEMKIGQLARRLDLNTQTIRYYERIGLLPEPERTESGYRAYGEGDERRLRFIKNARSAGLTLDEIKEVLASRAGRAAVRVRHRYHRPPGSGGGAPDSRADRVQA